MGWRGPIARQRRRKFHSITKNCPPPKVKWSLQERRENINKRSRFPHTRPTRKPSLYQDTPAPLCTKLGYMNINGMSEVTASGVEATIYK